MRIGLDPIANIHSRLAREFSARQELAECPDCGLLQILQPACEGQSQYCVRCGFSFGRRSTRADVAFALCATAIVLFALANTFPMMGIEIQGRQQDVHLGSGIAGLAEHGFTPLALFVLVISILAPLGRIAVLGYVLFHTHRDSIPQHVKRAFRLAERLRSWSMLDVFLIGALVSLTKLHALARVDLGLGFWALGFLVVILALFERAIDRRLLWDALAPGGDFLTSPPSTQWLACRECGLVQDAAMHCRRCEHPLTPRKPQSIERAAALVVTGVILYIPANLYPVMTVTSFGHVRSLTIMDGVIELMDGADWPLAVIVFTASVALPLLKLLGMGWLLFSTTLFRSRHLRERTRLYRLIELVSRWSTVDIFVAALLTALVTLGNVATIEPGFGALAFGAVVVVTMLATDVFDPRIMWDAAGANRD